MKEKKSNSLRLLADSIGRDIHIESFESFLLQLNSSGDMSIKGAQHISLCSENEIGIDCSYMSVDIRGSDLSVKLFSEEETIVAGKIDGISFLWGGKKLAAE
ncbi:MAG: YabP/YqfC family sporulation protein [Oscillospiraceae bacterium]|nr:YabP/YqfC family sporulation protein [Oscillospiraceae bacterium]